MSREPRARTLMYDVGMSRGLRFLGEKVIKILTDLFGGHSCRWTRFYIWQMIVQNYICVENHVKSGWQDRQKDNSSQVETSQMISPAWFESFLDIASLEVSARPGAVAIWTHLITDLKELLTESRHTVQVGGYLSVPMCLCRFVSWFFCKRWMLKKIELHLTRKVTVRRRVSLFYKGVLAKTGR